jgi:hypothetical protein
MAVTKYVSHRQPAHAVRELDWYQCLVGNPMETAVQGSHEEIAAWVLIDRIDTLGRAVGGCDGAGSARAQSKQATLRSNPDVILPIFEKIEHVIVRK